MPLAGGATDKAGNVYERLWTVSILLDVLEGRAVSVRLEVPGSDGAGWEFCVTDSRGEVWHQAKRQRDDGPWTISAMASEGLLDAMIAKLAAGKRCVFVSGTGAQELAELVERAARSATWDEFQSEFLTGTQQARFEKVQRAWGRPAPDAYAALRLLAVDLLGESVLRKHLAARLEYLVTGPAVAALSVLEHLVDDSLHKTLDAAAVVAALSDAAVSLRNLASDGALIQAAGRTFDVWERRLTTTLGNVTRIVRPEAARAFGRLADGGRVLVAGAAGSGKSEVAVQTAQMAADMGWPVLALSADLLPGASTSWGLGAALGLPDSPTTTLAGVAGGGPCLLVVDQLDAVSAASGRNIEARPAVEELIGDVGSHPNMRLLVCCRTFDLNNDRILGVYANTGETMVVSVPPLDGAVVLSALESAGLPVDLPPRLLELLRVPLHLVVWAQVAASVPDPNELGSLTDLYNHLWPLRLREFHGVGGTDHEWLAVLDALVAAMDQQQVLSVPRSRLDHVGASLNRLLSSNVVTSSDGRVSFFHETFFDYCYARRARARGAGVQELLARSQDLFVRAQVRQLIEYERSESPDDYLVDLRWLLEADGVRSHLRALVIAVAAAVQTPTPDEWAVLRPILTDLPHPLRARAWAAVSANPAWFPVLNDAGDWATFLTDGSALTDRAVDALARMAGWFPLEIARLITLLPSGSDRARRIRAFLRVAGVGNDRALFDLLLELIAGGAFDDDPAVDLWFALKDLPADRTGWGVEALEALLARATRLGVENPFTWGPLSRHDGTAAEVTAKLARDAPDTFVERILGPMLDTATAHQLPDRPDDRLPDSIWGHRVFGVRDTVLDAMSNALAGIATADPAKVRTALTRLASDPGETAWFLRAKAYMSNPEAFADAAAYWLAATPGALLLDYSDAPAWVSRELITAIVPHCSREALDALVNSVLHYIPWWERSKNRLLHRGETELTLMNAFPVDLLPESARRRLEELRRKFLRDDNLGPQGMIGSILQPPIPDARARRMTDDQWLGAIRRHNQHVGPVFREGLMTGGSIAQSQVLQACTEDFPGRFGNLFLRLPEDTTSEYVNAVLMGLRGRPVDLDLLVRVARRAMTVDRPETHTALARLIGSQTGEPLPDELLDTVAGIARHSPDPARDMWIPTESVPDGYFGGDPHAAGMNSARGAAVIAIGELVAADTTRLTHLRAALTAACNDVTFQVRAAATEALLVVVQVDPDLAIALLHDGLTGAPDRLLRDRGIDHLLSIVVQRGHYDGVADILDRMRDSDDPAVRASAARIITVASASNLGLDPSVDLALESPDEEVRAAVVDVFARNPTVDWRGRRKQALQAAFNDTSHAVRRAALVWTHSLQTQEDLAAAAPLLSVLAASRALAEHSDELFHALATLPVPLPRGTLDLCEQYLANTDASVVTNPGGADMWLSELVVRLHTTHADPAYRTRCLDLVDHLVESGAYQVDAHLDAVER